MAIFFKKNIIVILCLILFAIPFFWFSYGELDLGGDSTRLYFYDPISWLKNMALYSPNVLSGMGADNPNFFMIPFLVLLIFIKVILFNNAYFLNCFFSGLLLSGSFLFTYFSINELLKNKDKNDNLIKYSSIIGGLFFAFSPIIIYEWQKASYYFNYILVYPLMFFLFLKYINTKKYKYIIASLLVTFVFSVNFSFATFPWFFAFFPPIFLFLFSYSVIYKKLAVFLKGFVLFVVLFLLIQIFQFLPQINNTLDFSSSNSRAIFSEEGMKVRGLGYFLSVQPYVKLIYNITNQPQYDISVAFNHPGKDIIFDYGIKYQYLFFIYILIIALGLILIRKIGSIKEKITYAMLMGIFLILVFFMTANINDSLLQFYKSLFSVPGFAMFRSFYSKFSMVFIFFYALLIGMSLYYLLYFIKNKLIRFIFLSFISFLIIFNAWPLISGQIVNGILWQSKNVKITTKMSDDYMLFIDSVKNEKLDGKYLSLPLTNESYQVLQGQNGGAYFGPSSIPILSGKSDFPGIESFSAGENRIIKEQILEYLNNKDYRALNYLFSFLNIKYIFHNSDNYIYDNFPNYPYSDYLKKIFPEQVSIEKFINNLGYKKIRQIGSFGLYNQNNLFPHFYTPKVLITTDKVIDDLPQIVSDSNHQIRSAIYFKDKNKDSIQKLNQLPDIIENTLILEFRKINPIKYRIIVHNAKENFPLIFSESFHEEWKAYLASPSNFQFSIFNFQSNSNDKIFNDQIEEKMKGYKILDGNEEDQASKEELGEFIKKGWVSTLSDMKEREIKHKKWEDGKEKLDYVEKYKIDFISKNFQDTIQNDNLSKGYIWDTWFKKPLPEENHLMVNGYANSWIIETEKLCEGSFDSAQDDTFCVKNPDGSYDMELVVEFWPQRLFYLGLGISSATLLFCSVYLAWDYKRNRKLTLKTL